MIRTEKLGEVSDVVAGVGFPKEMQGCEDGEIPVFKVGDISAAWLAGERVLRTSRNYLSAEHARSLSRLVPAGSTVFAKIGEALRLNRRAILGQRSLIDNNVMGLVPRTDVLAPHYLFYFMQTVDLGKLARATAVPSVRKSDVVDIGIPLPSLAEQERVVAELDKQFSRLDQATANLNRVRVNLKRYKAAVLKAAAGGDLLCGAVPGEWRHAHIADVAQIISGLTKNPKRTVLPRKLPYLRVANVYANELRLNDIEYIGVADSEIEKLLLRRDDLLVVEGNGSADQIGRVALWDGSITDCVHQNHLIKVRFGADVLPRWALIWLLSPGGRHEIEHVTSSTSGLHTLSTGKVGRLPIPVPPLAVQRRIVAEVDRRISIVGEVQAELERNVVRAAAMRAASLDRHFGSNWGSTNG